jgi:hypothetical protein
MLPRFQASHQVPAFWVKACIGDSCADSLAIAAFPASFFATIPSYDFSPSITVASFIANLFNGLPFRGDDETSLGHVIALSPESSPPNFRSQWWYWTFPSLAGLSGFASQHGFMPPVPGFAFQSSAPCLTARALLVSYTLPPPRGVFGSFTR